MFKIHLKAITLTSLVTLLPVLAGLFLWNKLPDEIAIHFNINGVADNFADKRIAVLGLPLFLFALHWICAFATTLDPKKQNITDKAYRLMLWICPCISILVNSVIFAVAMNYEFSINTVFSLFFGLLFVIIGNYLPKCKQNYSIGIKIPWTLNNEDNWNYTHRIAGKLWFAGGIVIVLTSFLTQKIFFYVFLPVTLIMVSVPIIYSYLYHKKHPENND